MREFVFGPASLAEAYCRRMGWRPYGRASWRKPDGTVAYFAYFVEKLEAVTKGMTVPSVVAKTVHVKLTTQQVATVCGKQLQNNPGKASGCSRKCGKYNCDYNCTKDGCIGQCTNCPGQGRVIFPGLKSRTVIKNAVNSAQ